MDLSRHGAVSRSTDQTIYINLLIKLINNNDDKFIDPYRMTLPLLRKFESFNLAFYSPLRTVCAFSPSCLLFAISSFLPLLGCCDHLLVFRVPLVWHHCFWCCPLHCCFSYFQYIKCPFCSGFHLTK